MATRYIETVVKLEGEAEYKKALNNINGELKTLGSESKLIQAEFKGQANSMEALQAKGKNLEKQLAEQKEAVEVLEEALEKSKEAYGEHSKETQSWQQKLNRAKAQLINLSDELKDNEKYMDEARKSADGCATSIDKFGKEVKQTENEIDDFEGVIKALIGGDGGAGLAGLKSMLGKGLAVGAIVSALKETAGAVMEVVDSTKEYRTIMGSLEVSSQKAGYTAKQTAETYMQLYGVLGDTQTAATAAANLQALGLNQEQLTEMTNAAIGAWATYGDSIPIDSMAESINLASQQSEVSSALADSIEWAGGNVDDFKASLEAANSTEERAKIVLDELRRQGLIKAGEDWRQINADVVANNESMARYEQAMGELGRVLSPVADLLRNTMATAIGYTAEKLEIAIDMATKFIQKVRDLAAASKTATSKAEDAGRSINGSHATGLARVPFDGYLAETHKDEMIVPAAQAEVLRRWFASGVSGLPDAGTVRSVRSNSDRTNASSGEVIQITVQSVLDGRVVGQSVAEYQKTQRRMGG